jgi:hypothetical protein
MRSACSVSVRRNEPVLLLVAKFSAPCADFAITDSSERSQRNIERRMQCRFKITTLQTMTT